MMYLYQVKLEKITAAAIVSADGQIVRAAPILGAFLGQHINSLRRWVFLKKGEIDYLGRCREALP